MQATATVTMLKKRKKGELEALLKKIFSKHVGFASGISADELMRKVYGDTVTSMTKYERFYKYKVFIESALSRMRKNSDCFVIALSMEKKKRIFFVVESSEEAARFEEIKKRSIAGMKHSVERCKQAVEEKWYKKLQEG